MGTSLAEQLQKLAVPQTGLLERDKKRPSLLFDPKEAANLRGETFFQIGLDGFEELKSRNPAFEQFENTLFHPTSKDFERSVHDSNANKKLNRNIRRFCLLLSPYFMLNCSYKALEWLVYRYSIHEFNREELLMLILPYYETNIFVRAIQLLKLKDPKDRWHWLRPLQKPGVHLAKNTLFGHAASSPQFLQFVSKFVLEVVREHKRTANLGMVFNFYSTTFAGALHFSKEVGEPQVVQMLPVLLEGLSSDIPDFAAGSYIITAKLVSKSHLSEKLLRHLVEKITRFNVSFPLLQSEALLTLVILYKSQSHFSEFSDKPLRNVAEKTCWADFPKILQKFNEEGVCVYPFLSCVMRSCIKAIVKSSSDGEGDGKREMYETMMDRLVDGIKMDERLVGSAIDSLLTFYVPDTEYTPETETWTKQFMRKLETQYPSFYDNTVKALLKQSDDRRTASLRMILQGGSALQDSFEAFEKLYHPNSKMRVEGLKILSGQFEHFLEKDRDMLKQALIDRVEDDSVEVVCESLKLFKKKFGGNVLEMEQSKQILEKLLVRCQNDHNFKGALNAVVELFCLHYSNVDGVGGLLTLLPFLFPDSKREMKAALKIVQSKLGQNSEVLRGVCQELSTVQKPEQFRAVIATHFEKGNAGLDVNLFLDELRKVPSESLSALGKYLILVFLNGCLPQKNCSFELANSVLDLIRSYLEESKLEVVPADERANLTNCVVVAKRGKLPIQGLLSCITDLTSKVAPPNLAEVDFNSDSPAARFYLRTFGILFKIRFAKKKSGAAAYNSAFSKVLDVSCKNHQEKVGLLLNMSLCDQSLRLNCLAKVAVLINEAASGKEPKVVDSVSGAQNFLSFESLIVPFALINLYDCDGHVRKASFNTIQALLENCEGAYKPLLQGLLEMKEEVVLDNQQLPVAIHSLAASGNKTFLNALVDLTHETGRCGLYLNAGIVGVLQNINSYETFNKTASLALQILETEHNLNDYESQILVLNYLRLDLSVAPHLLFDSNIGRLIKSSLEIDKAIVNKTTSPAVLVLSRVGRDFFASLKQIVQPTLLDLVITAAATLSSVEVQQEVSRVFKHIDLDAALVLGQLQKMRDVQGRKLETGKGKRARRVATIPTADILDTVEWKKGVVVLESIQDKKKIQNTTLLLPVLFEVLKKCLDFEEQTSVEYTKQLLLTCIYQCCYRKGDQPLPKHGLDMQLVVQCVRASPNPQTHHHALLLLAYTAALIPDQVLHHIVAIFTFMGTSVLRHDDAYSFQIITKIVDTIIPILVQDGSEESVVTVLRVFVDVIVDIPEHRRIALFKQLLSRLGSKEYLHIFLLLVFEAHVVHGHTEKQKEVPKRLEVASSICHEFHPEVLIETCMKLIEYLRKLPEERTGKPGDKQVAFPFDLTRYSAKQFRHYKYTLVSFAASFLASTDVVKKVAGLSDPEALQLQDTFKSAIISILTHIQAASKVAERNSATSHAQYWKVLLHHSHDILDSFQALLTPNMFLLVMRGLVVHSLATVRKRSLELLNTKLQNNPGVFADCGYSDFQDILQALLAIITSANQESIQPEQELIIQTALLSLKLLVRHLAPENPQQFAPTITLISDLIKTVKKHDNILASLILCLAELCCNLRAHAISSLNKFMPVLVRVLKTQRRHEAPSLLLLSDVITLQKIFNVLPLFLSPYLEKLLYELALLSCKWGSQTEDPKLKPFVTKVNAVKEKIGSAVPLRVLLPAIESCYKRILEKGEHSAIGPLMSVLQLSVGNLQGADIQKSVQDLSAFFLTALQFRSEVNDPKPNLTLDEVDEPKSQRPTPDEVESHIIGALTAFVLKLSESLFRPLYYKLYDWAARSDVKTERIITFYSLSSSIGKSLKGLFVLFAGHFLNNASTLLDSTNNTKSTDLYFENETNNLALLENILRTLHQVFLYDRQRFINKDRFNVLMQPLVDQLENTLGGNEQLQRRSREILIPCIVQFALAVADDALWKQMNYQILLKTRHSSPQIRLIGLSCISEVAKKLGDDFLPLLPETIPFMAELLEDEEEGVEEACRRSIQELEKVLGEPLQKYF